MTNIFGIPWCLKLLSFSAVTHHWPFSITRRNKTKNGVHTFSLIRWNQGVFEGQMYGSHRGSFWSTEFDLKHSTFSIGKSRDQDHRHHTFSIGHYGNQDCHHTFSNRDYRNPTTNSIPANEWIENLWLIKILCSDEVEICQAKWVSVKTNRKSVLHELEICGFNLISVPKNEPLWLP